ncbi:hypothetical protein BC829DRAFT_390891 [Chytridium lagenaria]|nr:hypothetical protein BC829DRAFT_390891 [Chytridium lagenaria]
MLFEGILKYFDKVEKTKQRELLRNPMANACRWDRPHFARRLLQITSVSCAGTLVIDACRGGSIEVMEILLTAGLKHPYGSDYSLLEAVKRHHPSMVRHLIQRKGVNPNTSEVIEAMEKRHYDLASDFYQ